jgi:protein-tyrosine kinase
MGRVADAFTKAFPTRDEPVERTTSADPWDLAGSPETVEPPPDSTTSRVASKPQAGSAPQAIPAVQVSREPTLASAANVTPMPQAAPAPRVALAPRPAPAPHIAPARRLIPVPEAASAAEVSSEPRETPLAVVAPRPKERTQPTDIHAAGTPVSRGDEDRQLLRESALATREALGSGDPRYKGKLVGDAELSLGVGERFRSLAAALFHSARQTGTRVLLVASALPGEGKTLVSSNVAEALSNSFDLRVLLIDVDFRRPAVHSVFNLAPAPGLSESLESDLETTVPAVKVSPNLSVVVAGMPPRDPIKLVAGAPMQRLLKQVASDFDWVILDSPPLGLVSDAALLAELADKVLVVVKAGETPYHAVKDILKNLGPDRVLGVVLNQADDGMADPYGYTSRGYYADRVGEPKLPSV